MQASLRSSRDYPARTRSWDRSNKEDSKDSKKGSPFPNRFRAAKASRAPYPLFSASEGCCRWTNQRRGKKPKGKSRSSCSREIYKRERGLEFARYYSST